MPIFRECGVLRCERSMHLGGGIDGVRYHFETHQQAVAKALDHHAIVAWQDLGVDDADEFGPAANGVDLVLLHEPDRLHEVHQQDDRLLSHEANAHVPKVGSLRLGGWIFLLLHRITIDVERV